MITNKTTSFEVKDYTVEITQLSTHQSTKVDIFRLKSLLEDSFSTNCVDNKFKFKYSENNKHLRCDKNIINTFLTQGFDKKLIDYIEIHIELILSKILLDSGNESQGVQNGY